MNSESKLEPGNLEAASDQQCCFQSRILALYAKAFINVAFD